jgi:hypothetical protein
MLNKELIDWARVCRELADGAKRSRALKNLLRATWTRPMAEEQRELAALRGRITRLCILRAFARGKRHVHGPPHDGSYPGMLWNSDEYHARISERVAREYAVEPEAQATVGK